MLITLFEEQGFSNWCEQSLETFKYTIMDRSYDLLLSVTDNRRNIKNYELYKELLFNNLDLISFHYETVKDNEIVFNTCLTDKCITLVYDEIILKDFCKELNMKYETLKFFLNNISTYVTDSVIIQWKINNHLPMKTAKVKNRKIEHNGFFPISYNTYDFIDLIQKLCLKQVKFTPEYISTPVIKKDSIVCYFSPDRLETEYLIQQQLFEVYLYSMDFPYVSKCYFNDKRNWVYTEEALEKALNIILQNQFSILFLYKHYPIFENSTIYDLLNFKSRDCNIATVLEFLCSYARQNSLCSHCSGFEDIFGCEESCILFKDEGISNKRYELKDIDTLEKQKIIVENIKKNFNK